MDLKRAGRKPCSFKKNGKYNKNNSLHLHSYICNRKRFNIHYFIYRKMRDQLNKIINNEHLDSHSIYKLKIGRYNEKITYNQYVITKKGMMELR